MKICGI